MSWLKFFGLQSWTPVLIIAIFVFCAFVAIITWKYDVIRRMRESKLHPLAFVPIIGRRFRRQAAEQILREAKKGIDYAPESIPMEQRRARFMEFIKDLPTYQIDGDFFASTIRNLLGQGGAQYQQVVLHDSSSIDDVTLYVRKEGNYFLHNKGIYLFPWDCQKRVLHWDIQDCRPMEDKSPAAQWPSSKMNARYFWGIVNSVAMNKNDQETSKTTLILLAAVILTLLVSLYIAYTMGKANEQQLQLLQTIANNTRR